MDEFNDCCKFMAVWAMVRECARGEENQRRTQTLAATLDNVFGNLVDKNNFRMKMPANDDINRLHV